MRLFDGNQHAKQLEEEIKLYLEANPTEKSNKLLIVQLHDNASSERYIKLKVNLCIKLGIAVEHLKISEKMSPALSSKLVKKFAETNIRGIIIQLPLPSSEYTSLLDLIPLEKDIDLLSQKSQRKFYAGDFSKLSPVVRAVDYFLTTGNLKYKNLHVVIIGRGSLVGKPLEFYLSSKGSDVRVIEDYKEGMILDGNLVISGVGIPRLLKGKDLLKNCNVIDYGSAIIDAMTVGDLDMGSGINHLGFVSPSPGGLGPLVVRFLIENLMKI